jgi:lycopene beta-cyclase
MKTKNLTSSTFDLVFLGMGAANSLLFLELSRTQKLDDKKIAIIEPDSKNSNDRTFCFWAAESEIQEFHLTELISKSWDYATAGSQKHENISPL